MEMNYLACVLCQFLFSQLYTCAEEDGEREGGDEEVFCGERCNCLAAWLDRRNGNKVVAQ